MSGHEYEKSNSRLLKSFVQIEKLSEMKQKAERSLEEQIEQAKEVDMTTLDDPLHGNI